MFISIEGIDGSGKSSVAGYLADRLKASGREVLLLREPGGTRLGEEIRSVLLHSRDFSINAEAELFLYFAARAQLIAEKIRPALDRGVIVICDRFVDSSIAYQGVGLGIGEDRTRALFDLFFSEVYPDLTLFLHSEPRKALKRVSGEKDRIEGRGIEYYRRVSDAFLSIAQDFPDRVKVINADVDLDDLKDASWKVVSSFLQL